MGMCLITNQVNQDFNKEFAITIKLNTYYRTIFLKV